MVRGDKSWETRQPAEAPCEGGEADAPMDYSNPYGLRNNPVQKAQIKPLCL